MTRRWLVIGAIALLPMAAVPFAMRAVSEVAAPRLAAVAVRLAGWLQARQPEGSLRGPALPPVERTDELQEEPVPAERKAAHSRRAAVAARKGILVRREVVQAAARAGVRPSGAPVPASEAHPAGLQVHGLGGVGALRDGDVITKVGGVTPRSTEDVIAVVVGAYRTRHYVISGEFWRNGERWNAVVELPMPHGSAEGEQAQGRRR